MPPVDAPSVDTPYVDERVAEHMEKPCGRVAAGLRGFEEETWLSALDFLQARSLATQTAEVEELGAAHAG